MAGVGAQHFQGSLGQRLDAGGGIVQAATDIMVIQPVRYVVDLFKVLL